MKIRVKTLQFAPLVVALAACTPGGPAEDAGAEAAAGEAETHELHLESGQIQDWGVRIGAIETTMIAAELTLPGALTVNENRTAKIAPLVAGQISGIQADLGNRVGRGQTLATLNSPEFTRAQTGFLQAFAQAELSRTRRYQTYKLDRDPKVPYPREVLYGKVPKAIDLWKNFHCSAQGQKL